MRKLTIAIILALMVTLLTSPVALADEREDPEVANNGDFSWGTGYDADNGFESHFGEQGWIGGDGYNLYRDDATDTGSLDSVVLLTYTPDEIDLPHTTDPFWFLPGTASGASVDTWYWAKEPRVLTGASSERKNWFIGGEYDVYIGTRPGDFFNWSHGTYKWEGGYLGGRILAEGVSQVGQFNAGLDGTYKVDIPVGTQIGIPMLPGVKATGVFFAMDSDGIIYAKMGENQEYSNECTISKFVDGEWEVVVTFTKIVRGKLS